MNVMKIYPTNAARQKAWRQRQAERRLCAIKMWILPPKERARLARNVPWLSALVRERDELRKRLNEAERLAEAGRRSEAKINQLLDQVATLEQRERRREQNRNRKRRRREGGVLLASDPQAVREHYQQADSPSAFAQTEPTIGPRIGQDRDTISPRIAQDSPKNGTGFTQDSPRITPSDGGHDGAHDSRDWLRYIGIPRAPIQPEAVSGSQRQSVPASGGDKSAALLARIKAHGYQTKDGRVLYNNDRWIAPEEWVKLMPGILD